MFETWFFAVRGLMASVSAISAFSIPRAISRSTSSSRADSCSSAPTSKRRLAGALPDPPQNQLGGSRRKPGHSLGRRPHGHGDAADRGVLRDEAARAGLERGLHVAVVRGHGQDEHAHVGISLEDRPGRGGSLDIGHAEIHDHDVRPQLVRQPDPHAATGGLRHHLDVGLHGEQRRESRPEEIVIVNDEDANRLVLSNGSHHRNLIATGAPSNFVARKLAAPP